MHIKKYIATAYILFLSASSYAQYLPERGENLHFTLGHNTLLNAPDQLVNNWRSMQWQLQILNETFFGRKSHWSFGYGLGFTGAFWHTNLDVQTFPGNRVNEFSFLPTDSTYKSNRLSGQYIDVPLEIRYRSASNNKGQYYRFYFGGFIGTRVASFSHFRSEGYSVKQSDIAEMNRWQYGVFLRTGWYVYNLYVQYNLNPVFNNNPASGSPEINKMRSLTVGLSLSL